MPEKPKRQRSSRPKPEPKKSGDELKAALDAIDHDIDDALLDNQIHMEQ